jgi:hypothetical protein
MKPPWKSLRKVFLWSALFLLLILATVGLMRFEEIFPGTKAVTFSFAAWTNDAQGARIAVLSISNRSHKPVIYWADRDRQPRCDLMAVASRQKQGMHEQIVYTNLMLEVWTGHTPLQLPAHASVTCAFPWHDRFTNGPITVSYLPERSLLDRTRRQISEAVTGQSSDRWRTVALTGAPWTNAPADY